MTVFHFMQISKKSIMADLYDVNCFSVEDHQLDMYDQFKWVQTPSEHSAERCHSSSMESRLALDWDSAVTNSN